jgi:glyoxalase family protein
MQHPVRGLHHVTATVDDAQADLDVFRDLLGLRLVKKTVNFDNHNVFHFYYGNERGSPGTIWTTFPYRGWGVPVGTKGAGQVIGTAFSVPSSSLGFWRGRLEAGGVHATDRAGRFGEDVVGFRDQSGLDFDLVATDHDARPPWTGGPVGADSGIRGLHSVTLAVREPLPTVSLLTELLGFRIVDESAGRIRLAAGGATPGHTVDVAHDPALAPARNGIGTVHHVALAIDNADEQLRLRAELQARGLNVTEVRDRQYFRSIYFREPGGVLLEVATIPPGFTVDEDASQLGCGLMLPPWEEQHRAAIERGLPAVS